MNVTLFGSTVSLGCECLSQCLDAGHAVTVLVRNPDKLPTSLRDRITVITGDGLIADDVARVLPAGTNAIIFAIGVDEKTSPPNLCTTLRGIFLPPCVVSRYRDWCGVAVAVRFALMM